MKRLLVGLVGVLVVALVASGCSSGASGDSITVGVVGPMTGDSAECGRDIANGAKMAVEEFNASGVLKGKKIVVDVQDDKGDPNQAAIIAQRFVDAKVTGVVGHYSSSATAAGMPAYQKGQVPLLAPTASKPDLIKLPEHSYIFRTADSQEEEGKILADLFINKLKKKNIGIFFVATDWGNANHEHLVKNLKKLGANIVYDKSYTPGQSIDFQASLTAMAAAKPDLYYFGCEYNDAAMIIRQAREIGITETIGCSCLEYADEFLTLGGKAVEGVYLDTIFFPDSPDPRDKAFIDGYKQRYGKLPTFNASEAYEGTKVLLEAIRIGGTDRAKVRDALENMKDFMAFNRPVSYSPDNHNSFNSHYTILQVKDGKFVAVH